MVYLFYWLGQWDRCCLVLSTCFFKIFWTILVNQSRRDSPDDKAGNLQYPLGNSNENKASLNGLAQNGGFSNKQADSLDGNCPCNDKIPEDICKTLEGY